MNEEIQFHLEMREAELVKRGHSREEARRMARLEFGGVEGVKEEVREGRRLAWLEQLGQDLRYAARGFRRSPGFFAAAVGTLALGIGVTSVIVTLLYGLVFRPLAARDPERLVNVHMQTRGEDVRASYGTRYFVTWHEFGRMREAARTTELAGIAEIRVSWKGYTERALGTMLTSCNLPDLLGATPALGRFFTPEECAQPRSAPVVVLSHGFWQARFGGDTGVVGRTMNLNRVQFTIVGVAGPDVSAPLVLQPDIWIPITMQGITAPERQFLEDRTAAWIQVIGRLKPGETAESAQAEMAALGARAVREVFQKRTAEVTVRQAALMNFPFIFERGRVVMGLLVGAGLLVLLLGCANVANLLLARGLNRSREIAVRLAIGAGKGRLMRQLLAESLLLALAAGVAGLALAYLTGHFAARVISSSIEPVLGRVDLTLDMRPDLRMTLFAMGLAALTGIVFGIAPALQSLQVNVSSGLHGGPASTLTRRRAWLQGTLVAVQVAVCAVLLLNSALLVRGLRTAMAMDPGMARENVLSVGFDFRQQQYTPQRAQALLERMMEQAAPLAGVERAAASSLAPYMGRNTMGVSVSKAAGGETGPANPSIIVLNQEVSEGYLETLRIPLRAGRMFTESERKSAARVVLVSEDFVRVAFGGANPLGRRIRMGRGEGEDFDVIGVTGAIRGLNAGVAATPAVFYPLRGERWMESCLLFKVRGDSAGLIKRIREIGAGLDGELNVRIGRIEDNANSAMAASKMAVGFASALAALALLLACSGIAGVVAFAVGRRRREVGIRMALGSSPAGAIGLMMRRGMTPVFAGLAAGAAAALAVARLMEAMFYGVKPSDPLSVSIGLTLLAGVAALSAWMPARDAARVDPASVLRAE